jgi:hypothetical protein
MRGELVSLLSDRSGGSSPLADGLPEGTNWPAVLEAAVAEGVSGLLYQALRSRADIPAAPLAELKKTCHRIQARNIILMGELRSVLSQLGSAGIPVIALKGAALSLLVYGDIGLRPMVDLDLLVQPEQAERAVSILREAGYRRGSKPELRPGFDRQFHNEEQLRAPAPCMNNVDIHWQMIAPLFTNRHVDLPAVWERAVEVGLVGQKAYCLSPADWVLHQAAHAFYKHRRDRLLDLVDLDRLIRYLGPRLDWQAVIGIGEAFHWLPALAAVLPGCVEWLGTPIPAWALQAAADYRLPGIERRMLDWWLAPGRPNKHHVFPDWLTLPGFGRRVAVLWACLFPARAYMQALYPEHSDWILPFQYLYRLWRGTDFK